MLLPSQANMAKESTALEGTPGDGEIKSRCLGAFWFEKKKKGLKKPVGQTTSEMQTMQRDGKILWEYDNSPETLDKTSPGRNKVNMAQTNQPGASIGPSKLPANSQRAQKKTEAVAVFTCESIRPSSVVENNGFPGLIKTLTNN